MSIDLTRNLKTMVADSKNIARNGDIAADAVIGGRETAMKQERLAAGKTFLLGLGFFGVSVIWALYNAYVPIFLKDTFHLRSTLIGLIMTFDNILAILLLPYLGALSDRTRTRLGRRRPYILVGATLALVFFIFIPWANLHQRWR